MTSPTEHQIEPRFIDDVLEGVAVYHTCTHGMSYHWAPVNPKCPADHRWELISEHPLHIEPSLLCRACGDHGVVRDGTWVPA